VKLAEQQKNRKGGEVLPYVSEAPARLQAWPQVLLPVKREADLASQPEEEEKERQSFSGIKGNAVRKLMATYLRMRDVGRIVRLGMSDPDGDGRGWAAVALIQLKRYKEAARLAAGPDGETPCGYQTLRYVAHSLAKSGPMDASLHL
jgi:hypothetical protein